MTTIVQNGKLIENGKEVKPEFGNPDHIKALRIAGAYVEKIEGIEDEDDEEEGIECDVDITITAEVDFKCLCGKMVSDEITITDNDEEELEGERVSCCSCHRKYTLRDNGGIEAVLVQ